MKKSKFDAAVDQLLVQFGGSVTSGRRTRAHTLKVGGFAGDPHTWGFGVDVVWDNPTPSALVQEIMERAARELGIKIVREAGHDHLQPLDFPPGPVISYGGVINT